MARVADDMGGRTSATSVLTRRSRRDITASKNSRNRDTQYPEVTPEDAMEEVNDDPATTASGQETKRGKPVIPVWSLRSKTEHAKSAASTSSHSKL